MENIFSSADLHLAAYLLSEGCLALPPRIVSEKRVIFDFQDRIRCEALALSFCQGRATVEARRFLEAQSRARDLRDLALGSIQQRRTQ